MRLTPAAYLAACLLAGCFDDDSADRPLVCDLGPEIAATGIDIDRFFHPDAEWEQVADLASPTSASRKYGWVLAGKLRIRNTNEVALVVDSLHSNLAISAPGDTTARRFPSELAAIKVRPRSDTVVTAFFRVRMYDMGTELSQKFLDGDMLGYEMDHRYSYHLPDTRGCGPLGANSGSDTTDANSGFEGAVVQGTVDAAEWTLENPNRIREVFEASVIILSILLKVMH